MLLRWLNDMRKLNTKVLCIVTSFFIASCVFARDRDCLAIAVFKEANTESLRGQRAVLDVIYNRMRLTNKSACDIVKQRGQFSWVKTYKGNWKATQKQLHRLQKLDSLAPVVPTATHFARKEVSNRWTRKFKRVAIIGNHAFYSSI